MIIDPVCGMEIDAEETSESAVFQGQTYYFCSRVCREEFENSPEDFVGDEGLEMTGT